MLDYIQKHVIIWYNRQGPGSMFFKKSFNSMEIKCHPCCDKGYWIREFTGNFP